MAYSKYSINGSWYRRSNSYGSTGSSRVEKYKQPGRFQDTKHKVDFPTRSPP